MPSRTRTRLSLLLSLAALAASGCGEEEDVSPSFEDRVPLGLELDAADRVIEWKGETTLARQAHPGRREAEPGGGDARGRLLPVRRELCRARRRPIPTRRADSSSSRVAGREHRLPGGGRRAVRGDALRDVRVYVESRDRARHRARRIRNALYDRFSPPQGPIASGLVALQLRRARGSRRSAREAPVHPGRPRRTGAPGAELCGRSRFRSRPDEVEYRACYGYAPDSGMGVPSSRVLADADRGRLAVHERRLEAAGRSRSEAETVSSGSAFATSLRPWPHLRVVGSVPAGHAVAPAAAADDVVAVVASQAVAVLLAVEAVVCRRRRAGGRCPSRRGSRRRRRSAEGSVGVSRASVPCCGRAQASPELPPRRS